MTSSGSSSSRSRTLLRAAALALALLAACAHPRAGSTGAVAQRPRIAVFPVQNASGGAAPVRALTDALDGALGLTTLDVLPRRELDLVLANHRMRFTGGVDPPMAKVLREELGVEAVLVPTLEAYAPDAPPKVAIGVRLVATRERPVVLWADAVARSGEDAPGFLGLGRITRSADLERVVAGAVARSVERWVAVGDPGPSCGADRRFRPRRTFRAPVLDDVGRRTVAVLPFVNETSRRGAGDVVVNQVVAQLARSGAFEVLDPGAVREKLLAHRIVLEGGVSVDNAMTLLTLLDADLILSGAVQTYEARAGTRGAPKVELTAFVLDRRTSELVFSSASSGDGDRGVWFFGAGRVHTTSALSCRMIRGAVDAIVGHRPPLRVGD